MIGRDVVVELKNDMRISGELHSVDQYLNIKLTDVQCVNNNTYPHINSVNNCFIRGSVVRYIELPKQHVDTVLLQDATRRAHRANTQSTDT